MESSTGTIVFGSGVPALSIALAISEYDQSTQITIIADDEATDGQSPATSTELQMLRLDYGDATDLALALKAQRLLQIDPGTRHCVFPRGHIYTSSDNGLKNAYLDLASKPEAFDHLDPLETVDDMQRQLRIPEHLGRYTHIDFSTRQKGYYHRDGIVIDMKQLQSALYRRCLGNSNITLNENAHVEKLLIEDKVAKGVKFEDGSELIAERIIVAAGRHSGLLVDVSSQIEVTGYATMWLRTSERLLEKYKNIPVLNNPSSGFTLFPPVNGEFMCTLCTRQCRDGNYKGLFVPACSVRTPSPEQDGWGDGWGFSSPNTESTHELRCHIHGMLPELSDQVLARPTLSWSINAKDNRSLVDQYPGIDGLFVMIPSSQHESLSLAIAEEATKIIYGVPNSGLKERWGFQGEIPKVPKNDLNLSKPIVIVGAGAFGLTTALHLARRGYENITILDREPYDEDGYTSTAASADQNKIIRASYGKQKLYESLAFKALDSWENWNTAVRKCKDLPKHVSFADRLWDNCGFVRAGELSGLDPQESATQESFPDDLKHTQYRLTSEASKQAALKAGIPPTKLDPFERLHRGLGFDGILDGTGGYVAADKSCSWALHLCQKLGVHTELGSEHEFKQFIFCGDRVFGVETRNGDRYLADLVIVAGGGWTPSIVPGVADLLQTTAGSVVKIELPEKRPDLWKKYSSAEFPCWSWRLTGTSLVGTEVGGIYGFPRTSDGVIKIGFRGVKWTNFTYSNAEGRLISYPEADPVGIPSQALDTIEKFCKENMPDLVGLPLTTRLCWYTDSPDSNFLIDYVPGHRGLMVASGGSGHAFKFLPVLGEHVVDVMEKKDTPYVDLFKWREFTAGGQTVPANTASGGRWPSLQRSDCSNNWQSTSRTEERRFRRRDVAG
ncbi:hypothetical protein N7456_012289 [Penicillium angulare]|uniref:FAD dependent oxidoreductase domain-containing protein n=1 Tax=Penicillium angulare TaxID=116970 RepID=A0A9W9EVE4_9EURO|nr:hypothetical protein N7456_012289 [Penicillium angulare]